MPSNHPCEITKRFEPGVGGHPLCQDRFHLEENYLTFFRSKNSMEDLCATAGQ